MLSELARAKINLALHVVGVTDEGYHELDSLVVFANHGDVLTFEPASQFELTIDGPFSHGLETGPDNLVVRAAALMGMPDVHVRLTKNLPVASGIGGGSADAAATLRGLSVLCDLPLPSDSDQLALGADVPVCVSQSLCRMRGIGERLEPLLGFGPYHAVLVNPGVSISTQAVFQNLEAKNNSPMLLSGGGIAEIAALRNDLQKPATAISAEIQTVIDAVAQRGGMARMSGSGATCFGLFEIQSDAKAAATELAESYPNWWVQDCVLS